MPTERPLRVLVVDDHIAIRIGIAQLIDAERPRMHSVGAAASASEALREAHEQRPQVIVLDVDLAGEDGLALIPALQRAAPCAVVVLTSLTDPRVAVRALQLGASTCLSKTAPATELIGSIFAAARRSGTTQAHGRPSNAGSDVSRGAGTKRPSAQGNSAHGSASAQTYIEPNRQTMDTANAMASARREPKRDPLTGVQQVSKKAGDGALSTTVKREPTMTLVQFIKNFVREEDGAAAIEYGLIAALIAVAIIGGSIALGTSLDGLFTKLGTCMAAPSVANCTL
jgi:DNA-binding NarL/FixJ family response regulator/Flp pilus assembly pilin Flp